MKIIYIRQTDQTKHGYVATVNGFEGPTTFGKDEISALKGLVERLEEKNPKWIQLSDWSKDKTTL